MSKRKNPLFVVTNSGKDVEAAENFIEVLVKKLGLDPVIEMIEGLFEVLIANINSYATLEAFNNILSDTITRLLSIQSNLDEYFSPYTEMANVKIESLLGLLKSKFS